MGKEAVKAALLNGMNVIDTSAHFGGGKSEKVIAEALNDLISSGKMARNEVVIVTKVGHILGAESVSEALQNQEEYGDRLAVLSDTAAHCLSPKFIEEEISKSLERLGLKAADIVMLNHPERLLHAKSKKINSSRLKSILASAFSHLEQEVKWGRIGGYGVSSNTTHIPTSPDHISLEDILAASQSASSNLSKSSHLVAIGYPLNLFERDAVESSLIQIGTATSESLASKAAKAGLYQLTQRPLNAITGSGGVIRCLGDSGSRVDALQKAVAVASKEIANTPKSEPEVPRPPSRQASQEAEEAEENKEQSKEEESMTDQEAKAMSVLADRFQTVTNLEIELGSLVGTQDMDVTSTLNWSEALSENLASLTSNPFATRHYVTQTVLPSLENDITELSNRWFENGPSSPSYLDSTETSENSSRRREWIQEYKNNVTLLCGALVDVCVQGEQRANRELARVLKALAPSSCKSEPDERVGGMVEVGVRLVRGALNAAVAASGNEAAPFTVLVGAEQAAWAEEAAKMSVGAAPDIDEIKRVLWCPLLDE
ncbi:hypothetical protein HDU97_001548 [Phlyctochytrium planicorne]|nr:hypothetical protein HDU97_001548 [Phlyctochytrium planicorne]